eukprot:Nk52_evm96s151 gene=Nk52_evmTU96s151
MSSSQQPPSSSASSPATSTTLSLVKGDEGIVSTAGESRGPLHAPPPALVQRVEEEETYVGSIERIIQRDYFPDIPVLRAQKEYMEAVESNNPVLIREVQKKYRAFQTPVLPKHHQHGGGGSRGKGPMLGEEECEIEKSIEGKSLDDYLFTHTSEDNDSFGEIMQKEAKRKRIEFEKRAEEATKKKLKPSAGSMDQTKALALGESGAEGQKQKHLALMYPEGMPLTVNELLKIYGKKKINRGNTRFGGDATSDKEIHRASEVPISSLSANNASGWAPGEVKMLPGASPLHGSSGIDATSAQSLHDDDTERIEADMVEAVLTKRRNDLAKKGSMAEDIEDRFDKAAKSESRKYDFVYTPSPMPGVGEDESPLMTWGTIDGTPFRLDAGVGNGTSSVGVSGRDASGATPLHKNSRKLENGSSKFRIPDVPKKEQVAAQLLEKSSKKKKKQGISGIPAQSTSSSSRNDKYSKVAGMSPAARQLMMRSSGSGKTIAHMVSGQVGGSGRRTAGSGLDMELRSSYSPSPAYATSSKEKKPTASLSLEKEMFSPALSKPK